MTKVISVLALIAAIAAGAIGYLISEQKKGLETQLHDVDQVVNESQLVLDNPLAPTADKVRRIVQDYRTTQQELETATTRAKDLQKKLEVSEGNTNQLNQSLTEANTQISQVRQELSILNSRFEDAQNQIQSLNQIVQQKDQEIEMKGQEMDALLREKQLLDGKIAEMSISFDKSNQLAMAASRKGIDENLEGKIVEINKQWNFVIVNFGRRQNVQESIDFTIYREDKPIGKIRTVSVDDDVSVADVLPGIKAGEIQIGDKVAF
jgi:chromosome segregation ATPase